MTEPSPLPTAVLFHDGGAERLRVFVENAAALACTADRLHAVRTLADACAALTDASTAVILSDSLQVHCSIRHGLDPLPHIDTADPAAYSLRRAELVTMENADEAPASLARAWHAGAGVGVGSLLALPLGGDGAVLLFSPGSDAFNADDCMMLTEFCSTARSAPGWMAPVPPHALEKLESRRGQLKIRAAVAYAHRNSATGTPVALGRLEIRDNSGFPSPHAGSLVRVLLAMHGSTHGHAGWAHWISEKEVILLFIGADAFTADSYIHAILGHSHSMRVTGRFTDCERFSRNLPDEWRPAARAGGVSDGAGVPGETDGVATRPGRKKMVRSRGGFTLIELITVVLIVGLLAALAIPRFRRAADEGRSATIVSDLRNLSVQQELYYSEHYHYAASMANLPGAYPSPGVDIELWATKSGWGATASHRAMPDVVCSFATGRAGGGDPTSAEGSITCN
jgi:prepilin-type N-terminal cleavage/methylation domain-containing protein